MSSTDAGSIQPDMPDSIALGELAIAASAIGSPITIFYRYFSADVLSAVWRFYLRLVGPQRVHHVGRESDVRQLRMGTEGFRLVLVSRPRLYSAVAWAVLLETNSPSAKPAIFCPFPDGDPDEDPAISLVLHGRREESDRVFDYLRARDQLDHKEQPFQYSERVALDDAIKNAVEQSLQRRRDRQVVYNLIAGEDALRSLSIKGGTEQSLYHSIESYRRVHALLQSPVVRAADEPFDPLARDMVNRANTYLKFRKDTTPLDPRLARLDGAAGNNTSSPGADRAQRITRRELADLGNTRGKTVIRLIQYLLGHQGGCNIFYHLAASKDGCAPGDWPTKVPGELAKMLETWSEKQVRTHFHRLFTLNLITAEKTADNGRWQYDVPETLVDGYSPFNSLPKPEDLFAALRTASTAGCADGADMADLPAACPNTGADPTRDGTGV